MSAQFQIHFTFISSKLLTVNMKIPLLQNKGSNAIKQDNVLHDMMPRDRFLSC